MVNKNSPWYMEDKTEQAVPAIVENNGYIFQFNNSEDKLLFLEKHDHYREILFSNDGLDFIKNNKTPEIIYITDYQPKIDNLEIDVDVPVGYFRMFTKRPGFLELKIK